MTTTKQLAAIKRKVGLKHRIAHDCLYTIMEASMNSDIDARTLALGVIDILPQLVELRLPPRSPGRKPKPKP